MTPRFGADAGAIDPCWESAALRLVVLCDRPSASQEVHLFRALRRLRSVGACALAICSEADAADAFDAGPDAFSTMLRELNPHGLILSRFAGVNVLGYIAAAQALGVPVITHLDDYLLDVPLDLGAAKVKQHMRPERLASLRASLERADLLYISTPSLAARIRSAGFSRPIVISDLQSCADPSEISPPPLFDPEQDEPVRIGYQGTSSHVQDLRMIAPALLDVMASRPDTTLTLFGTIEPPDELKPLGLRLIRVGPTPDYHSFLARLRELRFSIGLAPLRTLAFNDFRTYTKWTEYTIAGAATLATDSVVYQPAIAGGAGMLIPDTGWREALAHAIDWPVARREMIDTAQRRLRTRYTLLAQEAQVLAMLGQVMAVHIPASA